MFISLPREGCGDHDATIVCVQSAHDGTASVDLAIDYADEQECQMLVGLPLAGLTLKVRHSLPAEDQSNRRHGTAATTIH